MQPLGTPLLATTYDELTAHAPALAQGGSTYAIDLTNTHIVTLRRQDPQFREITSRFDHFIPDGMPLIWCLNARGAGLRDRVCGPTFMRHCNGGEPGTRDALLVRTIGRVRGGLARKICKSQSPAPNRRRV